MTDRIVLQGISARGFHGVLDVEKADGQDFVVDVTLDVDLRRAGRSDLLAHTVNYAEVAADIVALITGPGHDLIETLADQIAAAALRRPLVQAGQDDPDVRTEAKNSLTEVNARARRSDGGMKTPTAPPPALTPPLADPSAG